jgi:acyl carrier protein
MPDARTAAVVEFLHTGLMVDPASPIAADTPLVSSGLLDSMGVVMLAAFVEERFGVRLSDDDVRAGGVETIAALLALVDERAGG